jgi:hypothetical protein
MTRNVAVPAATASSDRPLPRNHNRESAHRLQPASNPTAVLLECHAEGLV